MVDDKMIKSYSENDYMKLLTTWSVDYFELPARGFWKETLLFDFLFIVLERHRRLQKCHLAPKQSRLRTCPTGKRKNVVLVFW